MTLKNWNKASLPFKSLNDGSSDYWTASGSGTNEYYYNQSDVDVEPLSVSENNAPMNRGSVGSLVIGEWDYADNDSIGEDRIYVRLADETDPDTKAADYMECSEIIEVLQGGSGLEVIFLSLLLSNIHATIDAVINVYHTTSADSTYFQWQVTLDAGSPPFAIDSKIILNNQDKIKIMSSVEEVSILVNGDEE